MRDMNLMLLLPEMFVIVTAMGFLMLGVFRGNKASDVLCWSTCASFLIAIFLLLRPIEGAQLALSKMLVIDFYAVGFKIILLIGMFASLALSIQYLYQEKIAKFEYPVLVALSGVGMMFLVSATNFMSFYIALELQSLSLYILAAFNRNSLRSGEAAAKYFILGALSSGMVLFGISLVYGFTGSLDYTIIRDTLSTLDVVPPGLIIGMVFIIAAAAFKLSAAPFHMWTPDVYQGAPVSVTAFFAMVPKIAIMAALVRILYVPFESLVDQWSQVIYLLCVASLIIGSFAAIAQDNIKRLIAYSSIGNIGYALIGVLAASEQSIASVITFLVIYMIGTAGVFVVILSMRRDGRSVSKISDLAGLSQNSPLLAYTMAALMFSLSGIPPLAGFFGKLFIFESAIESGYYILAVLGVLASVVAAYYYLRVIKVMFFDESADPLDKGIGFERRLIWGLSMIFVLGFIAFPHLITDGAEQMSASLLLSSGSVE